MGSRLRSLAAKLRQAAHFSGTNSASSISFFSLPDATMLPCCPTLLPGTSRHGFSSSAMFSKFTFYAANSRNGSYPAGRVVDASAKRIPGARGLPLMRSRGCNPCKAFTTRAAQQQQPALQDDALLQSARTMRSPEATPTHQPSASTSAKAAAFVEGTIQRITYSSQETGYTVARIKMDKCGGFVLPTSGKKTNHGLVTVTGKFPDMTVGQQWKCEGSWTKHKTFGPQLVATTAEEVRPSSSGDLIAYLCGGATKGVGPVTAGNMVARYGDNILVVLDSKDAVQKLHEVKGIGLKTAVKIKDEWEKRRGDRGAREFLQKHGVSGAMAQKLVLKYSSTTEEAVRQDPYTCLTHTSMSSTFRVAEKLATLLGTSPALPSRAGSAMHQALAQAASSNGHTYMSWSQLQPDALSLMSASGRAWSGPALQEVAQDMFNNGKLIVENANSQPMDACSPTPDWNAPLRCYTPAMFNAEVKVASKLAELAARPPLAVNTQQITNVMARNSTGKDLRLSEGQRQAVMQAATAPVCILTGGPGCGKTTTTKYIVDLWEGLGKKLALCAPTGRASQRLAESSGMQAATIHRLLKWIPSHSSTDSSRSTADGKLDLASGGQFTFNERNPLKLEKAGVEEEDWDEVDAVLIDEASMLDLPLAAALLQALPSHCQLVFIGDVDQLPPVGAGKVLTDAIQSEVIPGVDLREIFRQAQQSGIVRTAHAVNGGNFQAVQHGLPTIDPSHVKEGRYRNGIGSDAVMMAVPVPLIGDGVQLALTHLIQLPAKFDVCRDVQVMSPMRKAAAGVNQLNTALQALLNPADPRKAELLLGRMGNASSEGDSSPDGSPGVMRQGDRVIQTSNNYQKDVFNGDIGFVFRVDRAERELVVKFPDKEVAYRGVELNEIQLAWASTVHKAQGSECPVVVLVLSPNHRPLLTRRLLYTALTRAKQLVVVVGTWDALKLAVEFERSDQRKSTLQQRISSLAVRAGAAANQKMVSYGVSPAPTPPQQQQQQQSSRIQGQNQVPTNRRVYQKRRRPWPAVATQPVHAQYAHTQSDPQMMQQVAAASALDHPLA